MPLVFVHGVANRPGPETDASTAQRTQLFRELTFQNPKVAVFNPDWGSHGVTFTERWLPGPKKLQTFAAAGASPIPDQDAGLGRIAKTDAAQAIDLAVIGALETSIAQAAKGGIEAELAAKEALELVKAAAV
ncbi:MAG: hypothetical protein QOJ15_7218 [Bradyrhizobium sp.]|jgi:hypothetical protein|nr:hypothetical protein [Bradyrhizobium sp.]